MASLQADIFTDLRVIELAGVLAGPSAGYFFAELGAKVIKVENPATGGDVTRSWKLKTEDPSQNTSAYFWSVNAGKEFVPLDLTAEEDRGRLYAMVRDADIVICNYKAGDDLKLGVDYGTLSGMNPKIIYASISGFGHDSPRTAYDLILQAESGFMQMNGERGSKGLKMPVALIDLLAGHQVKEAILIALLKRYRTGSGSHIHVSLFQSAVASLANQATNWLVGGQVPQPSGSLHPNIAPYGEIFDTKDRQRVTFAIGNNRQFRSLCEILGTGSLAAQPAYSTNHHRVVNRQQLYAVLYDYVKAFLSDDLHKLCLENEIPVGKIRDLKEVFTLPEAREMLRQFATDSGSVETVSGNAFRFL